MIVDGAGAEITPVGRVQIVAIVEATIDVMIQRGVLVTPSTCRETHRGVDRQITGILLVQVVVSLLAGIDIGTRLATKLVGG